MALPALLLLIIYALVTLGLRAMIHYRQTGSFGLHGPPANAPRIEKLGATLLTICVFAAFFGVLLDLGNTSPRIAALNSRTVEIIGLCLMVLSIAATFFAQLAMGRSWRVGINRSEKTALVTGGIYG